MRDNSPGRPPGPAGATILCIGLFGIATYAFMERLKITCQHGDGPGGGHHLPSSEHPEM